MGRVQEASGWSPWRLVVESLQHGNDGAPISHAQPLVCAQVLFRKLPQLPVPISIAYIPRGPAYIAGHEEDAPTIRDFWRAVHAEASRHGAIFLKVEPNVALDQDVTKEDIDRRMSDL